MCAFREVICWLALTGAPAVFRRLATARGQLSARLGPVPIRCDTTVPINCFSNRSRFLQRGIFDKYYWIEIALVNACCVQLWIDQMKNLFSTITIKTFFSYSLWEPHIWWSNCIICLKKHIAQWYTVHSTFVELQPMTYSGDIEFKTFFAGLKHKINICITFLHIQNLFNNKELKFKIS